MGRDAVAEVTRRRGFVAAVRAVGGTAPQPEVAALAADLETRWGAPQRGYHDLEHLDEVLARLDELGAATAPAVLAAWFHDAVYTGRPGRDERDSAALARTTLAALGTPEERADRVAALVQVTADHVPAGGDQEAASLCDADLAVLGSTPERYARYVDGVRREYRHLPAPVFRAGRRRVLRRLLDRAMEDGHPDGPLYRTPAARERWTARAVANLESELGGD